MVPSKIDCKEPCMICWRSALVRARTRGVENGLGMKFWGLDAGGHIDFCIDRKAGTSTVFLVPFLTMLHALSVSENPPHAHSAPEIPRQRYLAPLSTPVSPSPSARISPPASEPKLGPPPALSIPPDPNPPLDALCSGATKAGRRCDARDKRAGEPLPGVQRFC